MIAQEEELTEESLISVRSTMADCVDSMRIKLSLLVLNEAQTPDVEAENHDDDGGSPEQHSEAENHDD